MNQEDFNKILSVREKLLATYKFTVSEEQKREIGKSIKDLDIIIADVKAGRPVSPKQIESIIGKQSSNKSKDSGNDKKSFADIIPVEEVIASGKDYDFDQIYCFLTFFEKNMFSALSSSYLKLDFALSKKRDECFMSYESVKRMIDQYITDYNSFFNTSKDPLDAKQRLRADRRLVLVKLNDIFLSLHKLFSKLIDDLQDERNTILNKDEVFKDKFASDDNYFNGMSFAKIVAEADRFFEELIDIIDLPKF
jgi:hypothetical protein